MQAWRPCCTPALAESVVGRMKSADWLRVRCTFNGHAPAHKTRHLDRLTPITGRIRCKESGGASNVHLDMKSLVESDASLVGRCQPVTVSECLGHPLPPTRLVRYPSGSSVRTVALIPPERLRA